MQDAGNAASEFLTSSDVARLAGVTPDTVRSWERAGKLKATRTAGGTRLFVRAAVLAFIQRREAAQ